MQPDWLASHHIHVVRPRLGTARAGTSLNLPRSIRRGSARQRRCPPRYNNENHPITPTAGRFRRRGWVAVRLVLGVLLLTAAGLKLAGQNVSAVPQVGWYAQPWVQLAAAEWELVLGLWLISSAYPFGSWLAAIGTFLTFSVVSGYLGWMGVASCGCFGAIQASPWHAFVVDLTAVTMLAVARPAGTEQPQSRPLVVVVGGMLLILITTIAIGSAIYGSPQAAFAYLRGEPIAVMPTHLDVGSGASGTVLQSRVEVKNWSDRTVRVVGGTSDCSCVTHRDLPVSISPGESRWVTVELRVPRSDPGRLTKRAELFTDHERQPVVHLTVSCQVE